MTAARFLIVTIVILWASAGPARPAASELTILFTHDLHSHLLPVALSTPEGRRLESGGFARLSSAIQEQRTRRHDEVLLVDAGDIGMGTLFQTGFVTGAYELRLMARMGFDAVTLGNHDFDFTPRGIAAMLRIVKERESRVPAVVAANIELDPSEESIRKELEDVRVRPYVVLERAGLRIGIFGILGKDAAEDCPFAAPVRFSDPVATGRRIVETLRTQEKVDLVVCLSHAGTSGKRPEPSEDEALAREVPGIDVIVSGHTHRVLSNPLTVGGTTIVSCGEFGANLGILSLRVTPGAGAAVTAYELRPIDARIAPDPGLGPVIESFARQVNEGYLSRFGYRADQVLARTGFDLTPSPTTDPPADLGLGNLVTDAYREAVRRAEGTHHEHVHAAIHPSGHLRAPLLSGPITVSDVFRVLSLGVGLDGVPAYPLCAVHVTGAELKNILEVETSLAPKKPDVHLQVSGVRFRYNPNRLPFDRITGVTVDEADGRAHPLERDKLYRICVNYHLVKMIGYVSRASHGIIEIVPKDRAGKPLHDVRDMLVDADPAVPGTQELKEWVALARFLASFPDADKDGMPDVPGRYRHAAGRIVAITSWNPVDLVAGGTWITRGALLVLGSILAIASWLAVLVRRRRRLARTASLPRAEGRGPTELALEAATQPAPSAERNTV